MASLFHCQFDSHLLDIYLIVEIHGFAHRPCGHPTICGQTTVCCHPSISNRFFTSGVVTSCFLLIFPSG